MRKCVFCGSPESSWPKHIQNREAAKDIPLCEFHISTAMKVAVVEERNPERFKYVNDWNIALDNLSRAVSHWISHWIGQDVDEMEVDTPNTVYKQLANNFHDWEYKQRMEHDPPLRVYVDESEFTRWLCIRLKDIAKNGRAHRCSAYVENKPDKRCTSRVDSKGERCFYCIKHGRKKEHIEGLNNKLEQCIQILTSDDQERG